MSRTRQEVREPDREEGDVRTFSVTFPPGAAFSDQASDWDRLVYASRGVMRVRTSEGEWVVPPQRALWVPAGLAYRVEMTGRVSIRTLYFRPSLSRSLPRECRVFNVTPLLRELVLHVSRQAAADPSLSAEASAVSLLLEQLARIQVVPLQLPLPRDPRAVRAASLLSGPEGARRSLATVSRSAGASPRTLQRLFVGETGLTFERWRQRARLIRAVELLAGGRPVTGVSFDVGYDSPSAFIAMFRRELGTTPRRYLLALGPDAPRVLPVSSAARTEEP